MYNLGVSCRWGTPNQVDQISFLWSVVCSAGLIFQSSRCLIQMYSLNSVGLLQVLKPSWAWWRPAFGQHHLWYGLPPHPAQMQRSAIFPSCQQCEQTRDIFIFLVASSILFNFLVYIAKRLRNHNGLTDQVGTFGERDRSVLRYYARHCFLHPPLSQ